MITDMPEKRYGIMVQIPENDPMSAPHLLGENWSRTRWYDTEAARDLAFDDMLSQPRNYRIGDIPSIRLSKIASDD
ncbi:hypothetical protein ACUNV4_13475 [Granulosicoccus sp. 3-233]|uniref:hypothetical protein n=1 Tax=Granulosicoccus sp. 3-233 TaxID=3417969 RepID=UPI003D35402B